MSYRHTAEMVGFFNLIRMTTPPMEMSPLAAKQIGGRFLYTHCVNGVTETAGRSMANSAECDALVALVQAYPQNAKHLFISSYRAQATRTANV